MKVLNYKIEISWVTKGKFINDLNINYYERNSLHPFFLSFGEE